MVHDSAGCIILGLLQIGIHHVVRRMQFVIDLATRPSYVRRAAVCVSRGLPISDPGKDVRWHVQRMGRIRSYLGITLGGWQAALRERRDVVCMDEVMRHTRMIRPSGEFLLKDFGGAKLLRVSLVRRRNGDVQSE